MVGVWVKGISILAGQLPEILWMMQNLSGSSAKMGWTFLVMGLYFFFWVVKMLVN